DDEAASMGAALAFYTLFSIAPLLLLVISIAGLVIGTDTARGLIFDQLNELLGEKGAGAVEAILVAADNKEKGLMAVAASLATLIIGATSVFAELRRDLDRIWKFEKARVQGLWGIIGARLWSFGLVLTIGFLLMVSLALSAGVTAFGSLLASHVPGAAYLLRALEFMVSFIVITGLFAMIYKMLPSVSLEWNDVWVGAGTTSLLFWVGKYLIGLYLAKSAVASPFGAAGTLVVVIVWVYYSAQIFFLGAEFTRAYAMRRGSMRREATA
ncbi:MAG: YihY/virulence factor BrkB family protein, partial [Usitatibacter sp.]